MFDSNDLNAEISLVLMCRTHKDEKSNTTSDYLSRHYSLISDTKLSYLDVHIRRSSVRSSSLG